MELTGYFPTGILTHQVPNKTSDYIESIVTPRLKNLINAKDDYDGGDVLTDYYKSERIISKEELGPLLQEIYKCIKFYSQNVNEPVNSYNYWVQDYTQNQFQGIHNHGRSTLFSVVYWVRASEDAGSLVIEESNPLKRLWFQNQNCDSPFKYTVASFQPKKGYLVVFPGYLNHKVLPSKTNCIRTTIAFNFS